MSENNLESSGSASRLFILANKRAADRRLHTQDVEEFRADLQPLNILRTLFVNERVIATAIAGDALECVVLISEIEEIRVRKRVELMGSVRVLQICATNSNKPIRRRKWQRL